MLRRANLYLGLQLLHSLVVALVAIIPLLNGY
jgi:hypothetical protein